MALSLPAGAVSKELTCWGWRALSSSRIRGLTVINMVTAAVPLSLFRQQLARHEKGVVVSKMPYLTHIAPVHSPLSNALRGTTYSVIVWFSIYILRIDRSCLLRPSSSTTASQYAQHRFDDSECLGLTCGDKSPHSPVPACVRALKRCPLSPSTLRRMPRSMAS